MFHFIRKRKGDLGFIHAFVASLSVIIVSELGDKTFFIAAIMAMRHSRVTVLAGALGALALMTVLSGMFSTVLEVPYCRVKVIIHVHFIIACACFFDCMSVDNSNL